MSAVSAPESGRVLSAPLQVAFDYTRSTGPVLGAFFTGLRSRRILASPVSDGRVVVPPVEFDPVTYAAVDADALVEVADTGTVQTWTWVSEPVAGQPFSEPFAFALITLDGATAPMLHAIQADGPSALATGMRVRAVWSDTPQGHITDIAFFEPLTTSHDSPVPGSPTPATQEAPKEKSARGDVSAPGAEARGGTEAASEGAAPAVDGPGPLARNERGRLDGAAPSDAAPVTPDTSDPVTGIVTPVSLDYMYEASPEESAFFRGLAEGRILGQRCPACGKVYVPPRGACPVDGVPTAEEVELPDTGIVTTFCIVNVPFLGQKITPPYVSAYVLLDGADIGFLHLIQGVDAAEVRMGMRVRAVWKPREEWGTTVENIVHFEPTGEPDADFESYRAHL